MDYHIANSKQLAQQVGTGTAATILTPIDKSRILVYSIVIANTSSSVGSYSIYHDNDGTTFTTATALADGVSIAANNFVKIDFEFGAYLPLVDGASLGCKGANITFTIYGIEISQQGTGF